MSVFRKFKTTSYLNHQPIANGLPQKEAELKFPEGNKKYRFSYENNTLTMFLYEEFHNSPEF